MRLFSVLSALLAAATIAPAARAQSFNIDYYDGAGVPAATHGAAANQPGVWNNLFGPTGGNEPLVDLSGDLTSALVAVFNSSDRTVTFAPGLPDDVEPLLRDYVFTTADSMWIIFSNLDPGDYEVYTYHTGFGSVETWTATDPSTKQTITGEWAGDYALGMTHSMHMFTVGEDGELRINMSGLDDVFFNGLQLRRIPAPGGAMAVGLGIACVVIRRRR